MGGRFYSIAKIGRDGISNMNTFVLHMWKLYFVILDCDVSTSR